MKKLAIIGSRSFSNQDIFDIEMRKVKGISLVISGGAKGADTFAEKWATENNIPVKIFYPDWDKYGKSAGAIRNRSIIDECDVLIAFWDGESKGTKISIDMCEKQGKQYVVVPFK